jgi:REP element-mobilizing transposase RayT
MGYVEFKDDHKPLAYLITFRSYGTWLHGRADSVDRFHNLYGQPKLTANEKRIQYNLRLLAQPPVKLSSRRRKAVAEAIRETCDIRRWSLWSFSVRTNHVHVVVSAECRPRKVLSALKANATRMMREASCWYSERSPWGEGGSNKYIWAERELYAAIAYVLYDQGESLP